MKKTVIAFGGFYESKHDAIIENQTEFWFECKDDESTNALFTFVKISWNKGVYVSTAAIIKILLNYQLNYLVCSL